jgi:hypothetical protein
MVTTMAAPRAVANATLVRREGVLVKIRDSMVSLSRATAS